MSSAEVSPPHRGGRRADPRQTQTPLSRAKKVREERTTQKEKVSGPESSRADKNPCSGLRELYIQIANFKSIGESVAAGRVLMLRESHILFLTLLSLRS